MLLTGGTLGDPRVSRPHYYIRDEGFLQDYVHQPHFFLNGPTLACFSVILCGSQAGIQNIKSCECECLGMEEGYVILRKYDGEWPFENVGLWQAGDLQA